MTTNPVDDLVALLDANVLYPADLRDLLLELAFQRVYRARWTNAIRDEWVGAVLRTQPHRSRRSLERTARIMAEAIPDAIITGHEHAVGDLRLPDPNDRHVLAAAIIGKCDTIITQNLSDFPRAALMPHGLAAQHPDTFLGGLYEQRPAKFREAVRTIRARLARPPFTVAQYLDLLTRRGLTNTAERLRQDGRHL